MAIPTQWLKHKMEAAQRELEAAQQEFDSAQKRLEEARARVESFSKVMEVAEEDRAESKQKKRSTRSVATMADQMAQILTERGPLTSSEVCEILRQQGRENTNPNSVNTMLSKFRGKRFSRDENRRWSTITDE